VKEELIMNEIFKRRSIRQYLDKEVEKEKVEKLLKAAMAAPSAGNEQPWHFIVIKEREHLNRLAEIHPYASMLKEAPLAVAVCADLNEQKYEGFWVQDCSAATENILLEAVNLDLGAVWLGVYPAEKRVKDIKEYLELPENVVPLSIISVGYPAGDKPGSGRFKPERVHYGSW